MPAPQVQKRPVKKMNALREFWRGVFLISDAYVSRRAYRVLVLDGPDHDAKALVRDFSVVGTDMRISLEKSAYEQQANVNSGAG